jgi:hypothetical protein
VLLRATVSGKQPEELGEELAQLLKAQGAEQILADVRG